MRGTAGVTVEILCLMGVPSAQAGNLVHIETGVIDIDEACSGIRSLQAMVMIALFLGELFRLKPARRWLLVAFGLTLTLLANILRTVALSSIGFRHGMSAVDRYHDAAGAAVLILSLASTLGAAFILRPARNSVPMSRAPGMPPAFPVGLSIGVLLWFLIEEVSVETWYRLHEPKWQGWSWAIQWPRDRAGFHFIEIPTRSRRLLMCDQSQAAAWNEADGTAWSLYWIRWNPGNPEAEAAKVHRPDVCLNAEGAIMERDMGTHLSSVGPMRIPFHGYTFRLGEETLHVFFCIDEEGAPEIASDPRFEAVDMLQRALKGRRHVAEQSLELALSGYPSESSAEQAFNARLGQLMKIDPGALPGGKE
jgi:exosortase/archaeosortase family protein